MSDWQGEIEAIVIDLDAEFNLVLGLNWHRQFKAVTHWETMVMEITDLKKQQHFLITYPRRLGTLDNEPDFGCNTISFRDAMNALQDENTQAVLYFVRQPESPTEIPEPSPEPEPPPSQQPFSDIPQINHALQEYQDIFRDRLPSKLLPSCGFVHEIDTGDASPVNIQAYQLSGWQIDEQTTQVADLLDKSLIQESSSAWGSPVLFVKKPDDTWRMCVNYRGLNARTKKNSYPLPRIQECIDQLRRARFLSKIDLTSGYWQVRIRDEDISKTAFNTRNGKYEFLVMPFGLTNAPATFQTLVNNVFRHFLNIFLIVYLDDIVIYSNTLEEHVEHLRQVLDVLRANELYAKPHKCIFGKSEIEFCGHVVGNGTVKVMQDKIKAVKDWPQPKNVHEVRQFLGLAGYYRRFIKNFGFIALPLFDLTKVEEQYKKENKKPSKFRPIVWNTAHQLAFERLKECLTSAPTLLQVDPLSPFTVETDASDFAISASLLQVGPDRKLHPVAFLSRRLQGAENNYPVHEKELLAIKEALRVWGCYLENGHEITVLTDHESLRYLKSIKRPLKRLTRWIDEFQGWSLNIKYRRGSEAIVPDALSRRPDYMLHYMHRLEKHEEYPMFMEEYLTRGKLPKNEYSELVRLEAPHFEIQDDQLMRREEGVLSPYLEWAFRGDLVQRLHNEFGHLSPKGMKNLVLTRAWWPKMDQDIQKFVSSCPNCQIAQRSQFGQEREYAQLPTPRYIEPFQRWGIDLISPLPSSKTGNTWILTAIDYATGWPIAKALPKATSEAIAEFIFSEIYMHFGAPQEIFTDGGSNLWGEVVEKYLDMIKTRHRGTSPYHPRTNGKVESLNGLLGRMITKYLLGKPTKLWDLYLDQALFACRVRTHATTKTSPYYLIYGKHPRLLGDDNYPLNVNTPIADYRPRLEAVQSARQQASRITYERALRAKAIRDVKVRLHKLQVGDWVLVRHESPLKFESKWFGPYQVVEKMMLGTYRLQDPMGKELGSLVHGNRLVKANVDGNELRKMWARPSVKDELRRRNNIPDKDFVLSTDDNSRILSDILINAEVDDIVQEDDVDWSGLEIPSRQQDNIPPHIPVLRPLLSLSTPADTETPSPSENTSNPTTAVEPQELLERPPKRRKKTPPPPTRQSTRHRQLNSRYKE